MSDSTHTFRSRYRWGIIISAPVTLWWFYAWVWNYEEDTIGRVLGLGLLPVLFLLLTGHDLLVPIVRMTEAGIRFKPRGAFFARTLRWEEAARFRPVGHPRPHALEFELRDGNSLIMDFDVFTRTQQKEILAALEERVGDDQETP